MWRFLLLLAAISADASRYGAFPPSRSRSPTCSSVCPEIYQPICASCTDGHESTFQNECQLARHNSCEGVAKCNKLRDGECKPLCGIACLAIYQPICARCDDGEETTFGSDCELARRNNCEPDNRCDKVHDGECEKICEILCNAIYQPVCAICDDGQESTFRNDCELNRRNTCEPNKQCTKVRDGDCNSPRPSDPRPSGPRPSGPRPSGPKPSGPRPSHPRPSAPWSSHPWQSSPGPYVPMPSDPRPSNPRNPGRPRDPRPPPPRPSSFSPEYVPEPFRPRAPGPRSTCPVACPAFYQPVCADCRHTGETTFTNVCELEAANACNPHDHCTKQRNGECAPPPSHPPHESENDCDIICPFIYQPVCAQCPGEGERTFSSDCELRAFNSCNENPCTKQRDGECGPSDGGPSSQGPQPANPWSHGPQPANPWAHGPQPANPWSHGPQPANPWAHGPQPANPRPSGPWPSSPRSSNPWQSGPPPSSPPAPCPMIACPSIYEPVCARFPDGSEITFGNACELEAQNSCNPQNQCTQIYDGECRGVAVNPGGPPCPDACTDDYRPVCAQCPSGIRQTFSNACSLQQHYCQTGEECIQVQEGVCEGCIRPCPISDAPAVCAICNDNRYRSFPNTCLMENYNCQNHDNCQNVSQGIRNTCPPQYPGLVLPPGPVRPPPRQPGHIPPPPPPRSCCDKVCPAIYQPVCARCAHGEVTFQNSCEMDSHNCQTNNECEKIRDGECPPQNPPGRMQPAPRQPGRIPPPPPSRSGCDRPVCPAIYQPVCARCAHGAVTFQNSCEMDSYNDQNNNECEKTRDGECTTCPQVRCSTEWIPICAQCGSEKRTFDNECMFNAYNCPAGFECTKVNNGTCEDDGPGPVCPLGCTRQYDPVCAQCPNGEQTFSNLCVLQQNNCQSRPGCTYLRDGECRPSSSCGKVCPLYDIQICARCDNNVYRTFANPCFMDIHNCQTQENCQYVSQGEGCPADPAQPPNPPFPTDPAVCAAIDCSPAREPVCARCGSEQTLRTFNNECMLNIHNCFNNQECKKTRDGACQESPEPVICPTQRDPVCATTANGPRTFPNRCFLNSYQILNPQDNCTQLYPGTCRTTCPLYNCLDVSQPICALCGFEQKTFDNECYFNSYNCPAGYECTKISDGPCQSVPPLICTGEYRPVCATCSTGLETFANDCFMNAHNLANPDAQCVSRNEGSCSDISACPLVKCPSTPAPVCGLCGNQKMTFTNDCQFRSYNCRSGYACRVLSAGSCELRLH